MPTTTRTGGTVTEVKRTVPGPVFSGKVSFPPGPGNPPVPPAEEVPYADIDRDTYDDLRAALGKAVLVDMTTDDGTGAVVGVKTRKA